MPSHQRRIFGGSPTQWLTGLTIWRQITTPLPLQNTICSAKISNYEDSKSHKLDCHGAKRPCFLHFEQIRVNCKVCTMWNQEPEFGKNLGWNSLEHQSDGSNGVWCCNSFVLFLVKSSFDIGLQTKDKL